MLTSPKLAHKELINFTANLGIHVNGAQASLDASAKGEAISKGDIITYRDPAGLVVAEVCFVVLHIVASAHAVCFYFRPLLSQKL